MLDYIDNMLRQLFITQVPGIISPLQVRFQPPDDDWRTYVSTLGKLALNVYMIELKENREMRSSGRTRDVNLGIVSETPLPRYRRCALSHHGMGSAGHPSGGGTNHRRARAAVGRDGRADGRRSAYYRKDLLSDRAADRLSGADRKCGDPDDDYPARRIRQARRVLGHDAGHNHPWRPAVLLILTLPVTLPVIEVSPMVTTRITEYRLSTSLSGVELWAEIGGTVFDANVLPPCRSRVSGSPSKM